MHSGLKRREDGIMKETKTKGMTLFDVKRRRNTPGSEYDARSASIGAKVKQ